jgi:tetratricopeptide (TPR) repeat protein
MTVPRILIAGLLLAITPATARAQRGSFVQATHALAEAAQSGHVGTPTIAEAVTRMKSALAAWDRAIGDQEARTGRELAGATAPRRLQLHVELAVEYRARGRLTDALREFDAAAEQQPSSGDVQLLRGLTLAAAGKTDLAARAFRAAWTRDPENVVKCYYLLQYGPHADATETARALATLNQAYATFTGGTARQAATFPMLDAIPDWLVRVPIVGDARTGAGFALLAAGKFDEALVSLSSPVRATRESQDPLARFAQAQIDEKENRPTEARAGYSAALAGALAGRSTISVAIGRLAQVEGDEPGAIDAFAQAVRLNPYDPTFRQELANAYASAGHIDSAFAELVAGLVVNPANAALHAAVGQLRLDHGRPADAIPAFTRALELSPEHYEVRYGLATALARSGNATAAARELALFEAARRQMLDQRRREIQSDVDREDDVRRGLSGATGAP